MERLGKTSQILPLVSPPTLCDASGRLVTPSGVITLDWRWSPNGTKIHQCDFFIFPEAEHLDVVFGVDFIQARKLLTPIESNFLPLVVHKKETAGTSSLAYLPLRKVSDVGSADEKANRARLEEKQRREKAALEARRLASQSVQQQKPKQRPQSHTW